MTETAPDKYWLERAKAVGAAQSRYLWILLLLMVFFAALRLSPAKTSATLPVIGLEISSAVVLSSGIGVLSFIVLATTGTMRALKRAEGQGLRGHSGEEFDVHPNVIDMALYCPPGSNRVFVHLARAAYLLFLALGLLEAAWLSPNLTGLPLGYASVVGVVSGLIWIRAGQLVIEAIGRCVRDYRSLYGW
jgi:hypothetical protein